VSQATDIFENRISELISAKERKKQLEDSKKEGKGL
jgi:hypothetical protein